MTYSQLRTTSSGLWIPDSGDGVTIVTIQSKAPLLTEQHVEEWKKSMKNDLDAIKNEINEDLKKLTEVMKHEIGASIRKMAVENLQQSKNDFERQKKEITTHFEGIKKQMKEDLKSNVEMLKEVKDRDLQKTVAYFKAEIERLKRSLLPKTFNEECYKYT